MQPAPLNCSQHRLINIIPEHQLQGKVRRVKGCGLGHGRRQGQFDPKVKRGATSNLYVLGGPKKEDKVKIGCITLAFSGAHKWAELLCNPCVLGGPRKGGQESQVGLVEKCPKGRSLKTVL